MREKARPRRVRSSAAWVGLLAILALTNWSNYASGDDNDPERTARAFTIEVLKELRRTGLSFEFNTLMTAEPFSDAPAYADILVDPEANFLPCQGGPFALCYYSGPEGPLPCDTRKHDPLSECECIEIAYGNYYVDINAILDVDTYLKTVEYCGTSGENCGRRNSAPVCTIINANKLFPGADMISVFSFECAAEQNIGTTTCPAAVYAGCMTARCYRKPGEEGTVECLCPNFDGPYQIGQNVDPQQCDIGPRHAWSAAFNVNADGGGNGNGGNEAVTFPTPDGCVPDDPSDAGCPLLEPGQQTGISPDSELCQAVCQEYAQCTRNAIEVGFTCDATLCTSECNDRALVEQACSGLKPPECQTSSIIQVEELAGCSCCASQICGCEPTQATNEEIFVLNELQRDLGIEPQCDINGTLCGVQP